MSTQLLKNGSVYTYRPVKEIAKDIRTDIKKAIKEGTLPNDLKVSVTMRSPRCINITYTTNTKNIVMLKCNDCYSKIQNCYETCGILWNLNYSETGNKLDETIKKIANAYNYDNSDVQSDYFDVNYYLRITLNYEKLTASNIEDMDEATAEAYLVLRKEYMPIPDAYRTALALTR
jgi:hypothetical protein